MRAIRNGARGVDSEARIGGVGGTKLAKTGGGGHLVKLGAILRTMR